ncbi:MAG: hypothetical protein KJ674_00905 [Nanoarchaeota archaeon]|nr:hypothetical protein [Nanoarchaeota archaeon]
MKKSQVTSGSSVAVFIFLFALFMVLFILLLPPEDREALLQNNVTGGNGEVITLTSDLLLQTNPGLLKQVSSDKVIHDINSINLYLKNEPTSSDLASSLSISKSLFSENKRQLIFNIEDLENLDKVSLYFVVGDGNGNLIIVLNGMVIYDEKAVGLVNVVLPTDILGESNSLTFKVSSPGWNIFGKNYYSLSSIKIRESYELTNNKESRKILLTEQEDGNGELSYFLYCNKIEDGARLRIFVNNKEVDNGIISCHTAERTVEIDKDDLNDGYNDIMFEVDKGDYVFTDIQLEVESKDGGSLNYKFSLSENQYDDVLAEDKDVRLFLEFNDDEIKKATLSVNGNEFSLDTDDIDYEYDISNYVKEGNNFFKIIPINEFNVDELSIELK